MNRIQRNAYATSAKRVQNRMEALFIGPIYSALKRQISSFTSMVRSGASPQAALQRLPAMDERIADVIQNIHLKAGRFAAREARKNILRETSKSAGAAKGLLLAGQPPLQLIMKAHVPYVQNARGEIIKVPDSIVSVELKRSGFGFNERMTADILEYFRLHLLEKAVLPISATTKERIQTVLNRAIEGGWGVDRRIKRMVLW